MTPAPPDSVSPYSGWERREFRLSRAVTADDIAAFLGKEELYTRDTSSGMVNIIHKYGLIELHCIIGNNKLDVWFNPDKGGYPSEYLDALLATRFY